MDGRTLVTVCLLIPIDPINIMVNHSFEIRPYLAEQIVSSISSINSSINLFDVTMDGCTVEIGNKYVCSLKTQFFVLFVHYCTVQHSISSVCVRI